MRTRSLTVRRAFDVLLDVDDDSMNKNNAVDRNLNFNESNLLTIGQWVKLWKFNHFSKAFFLQHALRMANATNADKDQDSLASDQNNTSCKLSVEEKAKVFFNCIDFEKIGKIDQIQFAELCNYLGFKIKEKDAVTDDMSLNNDNQK